MFYIIHKRKEITMENYLNNDLTNPKFLFHGSPKLLEIIEQRKASDSNGNFENEDLAVYLTSSFIIATAYAFKDQIKAMSEGKKYVFDIGGNSLGKIFIKMDNVEVADDIIGYVYVFKYCSEFEHLHENSIQYKCYENIKPIDTIKVKFSDYRKFYSINENDNNLSSNNFEDKQIKK